MTKQITIGSRGSKLALIQSNEVKAVLKAAHPSLNIQIHVIKTRGDKTLDTPIADIGGKGLFTAELEKGLINHEIDLAVHSLKDLPSKLENGFIYAGSPKREDVRDAFQISLKTFFPQGISSETRKNWEIKKIFEILLKKLTEIVFMNEK